jgi:hypothetical protein
MKSLQMAVLLSVLLAAKANGQVKVGDVQPNRIVFGKLHAGAAAEASFLVFAAPSPNGKAKFEVTTPSFVKVLRRSWRCWRFASRRCWRASSLSFFSLAARCLMGQLPSAKVSFRQRCLPPCRRSPR